jgi:hypothetical protein
MRTIQVNFEDCVNENVLTMVCQQMEKLPNVINVIVVKK